MIFQNAPAAFDRIVLAMIGRIICQAHRQTIPLREIDHAVHELGAPTMVLRPIIEIDNQGGDVGKP